VEYSLAPPESRCVTTCGAPCDDVDTLCTTRDKLPTHPQRASRCGTRLSCAHPVHTPSTLQLRAQQLDAAAEFIVTRQVLFDFVYRMDHGRVVATAEQLADLDE
jgi:hypothetical protein